GDDAVAPCGNDAAVDGDEVSPGDSIGDGPIDGGDAAADDCSCGRDVSGTRLKRIYTVVTASDGSRSRQTSGWHDSKRAEDCEWVWRDGETTAVCRPIESLFDVVFT